MKDDHSGAWDETGRGLVSPSEGDTSCKKRKEELEQVNERLEDVKSVKKARIVWTVELHQQFLNAVNQLSIDNAHPMRILEVMNVQGLSVGDLARHLGKYWMCLKRSSGFDSQPSPVASFQAAQAGYFGSSLKIQPGGREVAAASSGKVLNVPQSSASMGVLSRGLAKIDAATLRMLGQLQAQAGLWSSSMLGGVDQLKVEFRPGLASRPSNLAFTDLQRINSLKLYMLMKAAQ